MEPLGAPEIGHRPLGLGVGQPIFVQAVPAQIQLMSLRWEAQVYEDHYRAAPARRTPNRTGAPVQHRLAKLDSFKCEIGERLDDFVYQVEEVAAFHAWDPVETCRQDRTRLWGVALAYIRRTPLPPRDWTELKDLLTRRFQPRDLTVAYKAQFRTRRRQKSEDIRTYVDALQKLAEMAWPLPDPIARDEMVADQFLNGLDSHELRVQVAAMGIWRMEDLMHLARSLEAVEGQEAPYGRQRNYAIRAHIAYMNYTKKIRIFNILNFFWVV